MESQVKQVLVVASKTANSDRLMKEIEGRAAAEGCRFTLLIPDASDREKADRTLAVVFAAHEASSAVAGQRPRRWAGSV